MDVINKNKKRELLRCAHEMTLVNLRLNNKQYRLKMTTEEVIEFLRVISLMDKNDETH